MASMTDWFMVVIPSRLFGRLFSIDYSYIMPQLSCVVKRKMQKIAIIYPYICIGADKGIFPPISPFPSRCAGRSHPLRCSCADAVRDAPGWRRKCCNRGGLAGNRRGIGGGGNAVRMAGWSPRRTRKGCPGMGRRDGLDGIFGLQTSQRHFRTH